MKKVDVLASPEFAGRLSGSEGYNKASKYVKNHFINLGLKPAFSDDYYQKLFVEYNEINQPVKFCLIKDGNVVDYQLGSDYAFRGFTGSGDFTAPAVFCGYGISTESYNDYENVDVKGKIAIVFKQNPTWKPDGIEWGNGYPREKAKTAFDNGAIGLMMVSKPLDNFPQPVIGSIMDGAGDHLADFPQLQISQNAANDFLSGTGYSIKELQKKIDETQKPYSLHLSSSALISVNTDYYKEKETQNIAVILEGNDEILKNEYVVVGAHLDHVGSQGGEVYYPGANDNASGSAGVMQIAEAIVKSGVKPDRSIIFTLFASEEQGLFGSDFFSKNPPVNLNKITAMINMDCIGSGDSIQIGNGKSVPGLWNTFRDVDSANKNLMIERTWSGGGADATPFHNSGIPSVYVVSHYSYEYLHQPGDKPETLNAELFENIVKLTAQSLLIITDKEYKVEKLVE
ncbi:MAG: M20/M25/M40 family metallo-hydrolase [Ignavibacteriaceae bacterium]